jgi:hypothetical protein
MSSFDALGLVIYDRSMTSTTSKLSDNRQYSSSLDLAEADRQQRPIWLRIRHEER